MEHVQCSKSLPNEIFDLIIASYVDNVGLYAAWQTRAVSRSFRDSITYYVIHRIPFTRFLDPRNAPSTALRRKTDVILSTVYADILASTVRRTTKTVPTFSIDARVNRLLAFDDRSNLDPIKEFYRRDILIYMSNLGMGRSGRLQFLLDLDRDHNSYASTGIGIFEPFIAQLASATATGNLTAMHFFFLDRGGTAWASYLLCSLHPDTVSCIFRAAFRAAMSNRKDQTINFLVARFVQYMVSSLHSLDQARHVTISAIHDAAASRLPEHVQYLFYCTKTRLGMDVYDKWRAFPLELNTFVLVTFIRAAAQSGCADTTTVMLHEILILQKMAVDTTKDISFELQIDFAQEAFYTACKHGHVKITYRLLLRQDVEISQVGHKGLYVATRYQRRAIIDVLIEWGADINKSMVICTAVERGYVLTTLHFIRRGAIISKEVFERCREKEVEMAEDSARLVAYCLLAMACDRSWFDAMTSSFLDDIWDEEGLRGRVLAAWNTETD